MTMNRVMFLHVRNLFIIVFLSFAISSCALISKPQTISIEQLPHANITSYEKNLTDYLSARTTSVVINGLSNGTSVLKITVLNPETVGQYHWPLEISSVYSRDSILEIEKFLKWAKIAIKKKEYFEKDMGQIVVNGWSGYKQNATFTFISNIKGCFLSITAYTISDGIGISIPMAPVIVDQKSAKNLLRILTNLN